MQDKIRYLKKVFGKARLQNNGFELMVPCPNCKKQNKLKMNINLNNDLYHCWVCNLKGKNLGRLIKLQRPAMVAGYFEQFGSFFGQNNFDQLQLELDPVKLPEDFSLVMMNLRDPDALAVRNYARSRGISDSMLWRFRAGYSCEWKYSRRLIIPSFDQQGELNYWVSRAIDDTPYKYINAKAEKTAVVFNEIDIDWNSSDILLVEGPLDLIKCGNLNAGCLLGSSLHLESCLFYKLAKNSMDVTLALDSDAWTKQLKIAKKLSEFDLCVYLATPTSGDVGDLNPQEVDHLISSRIKYDKKDFDDLNLLIHNL